MRPNALRRVNVVTGHACLTTDSITRRNSPAMNAEDCAGCPGSAEGALSSKPRRRRLITLRARRSHRRRSQLQDRNRPRRWSSPGCIRPAGGSGQAACSGDMLLEALVACAGVTLNAESPRRSASSCATPRWKPKVISTSVERWAWPRTLRSASTNVRLQFAMLDTDASEEQLATLMRLTERYSSSSVKRWRIRPLWP